MKTEHKRIDAFELWCWRRLLRVRWTARRSLEGQMLKLQYFGHLMRKTDSFQKALLLGKIESRRKRRWWRMRWWNGITDSMDMCLSKLLEIVKNREAWCAVVHIVTKSWTWLSDWTKQQQISGYIKASKWHDFIFPFLFFGLLRLSIFLLNIF